jgi:hypothetical protein
MPVDLFYIKHDMTCFDVPTVPRLPAARRPNGHKTDGPGNLPVRVEGHHPNVHKPSLCDCLLCAPV